MSIYDKICYYYKQGIYKDRHILLLFEKGNITEDEYISIVRG